MNKNFHKIHKYLLDRSETSFLRNVNKINKIISINDIDLDFSLFCKIISHQISNNIAKILWKIFAIFRVFLENQITQNT